MTFKDLIDIYLITLKDPSSCIITWFEGRPIFTQDTGTHIETVMVVPHPIKDEDTFYVEGLFYKLKTNREIKKTPIDIISDKINSSF